MKTYYQQLKTAVLPRLAFFRDDLLKIDRGILRGYSGRLIHASRESGTDLICIDKIETVEKFRFDLSFTFRPGNDLYFIGGNGQIEKTTARGALEFLAAALPDIAKQIARSALAADDVDPAVYSDALEKKTGAVYHELLAEYADAGRTVDQAAA